MSIFNLYSIHVLSKNKKNVTHFHLKIATFTAICSLLHKHINIMGVFADHKNKNT